MLFIAIWFLFGIGAAMAAAGKGRNPAGWFFLGMLLGPFGLLFALLSGKVERPVEATSGTRKCPTCAERILRDAVKCRFCGEQLPPIPILPGEIYYSEGWWRSDPPNRYGPYTTREQAETGGVQ